MVLDSSAIVGVILREPGFEVLVEKMESATFLAVGTPTVLECTMVLTARLKQDARPMLYAFLRRLRVEMIPFNAGHLDAAIGAFLQFGRGRHPAGLNFGDCLSYAIASEAGMPLLFKGADFGQTDIDGM